MSSRPSRSPQETRQALAAVDVVAEERVLHLGVGELDEIAGGGLVALRGEAVRILVVGVGHVEVGGAAVHFGDETGGEWACARFTRWSHPTGEVFGEGGGGVVAGGE